MILPDVNVLVHAFRADSSNHALCWNWLESVINGDIRFGMSPQVLSGVIRVLTSPRIFAQPSTTEEAIGFCDLLMVQSHCVVVQPGAQHWHIFSRLCREVNASGNLVPDAWFAALAMESGCEWITLDRDFARFKGLRWSLPG